MLKDKFKFLTDFFKEKTKGEGNNKKNIENLVVFLILLIITIIAINTIWGEKPQEDSYDNDYKTLAEKIDNNAISNISEIKEYNLQEDIENILSKMEGVGKVQVLITYSESSSIEPMYNESNSTNSTEEQDSNGGTRKVETSDFKKEIVTDSR